MNFVTDLIKEGESARVALLPPQVSSEIIGRTVCGMLNQDGGQVLWGVEAKTRLQGLSDAFTKAKELNEFLMRNLVRRPLLSVSVEEFKGQQFILVEIPPGPDKPYAFARKIWVRLGSRTLLATEDKSAHMVEERATGESMVGSLWGREPMPGFQLADCDPAELAAARQEMIKSERLGIPVPEDDEELLRRLYLYRSEQLSNAAMVLFAADPMRWAPNLALRIVSYRADKQDSVLYEQTLLGPAVRLLNQGVSVIQQQTGFAGRFSSQRLERQDRPVYALYALREGLTNAIVHRDYESPGGQVRVEIFPDRLVIVNPGRLPEGWTQEDIAGRSISVPPNPDIAWVVWLRGYMERLGQGGRRLVDACQALKAKPPVWEADKGIVSLTLFAAPRPDVPGRMLPRQEKFLEEWSPGAEIKADDYAAAAHLSIRQARRDLGELEGLGLVERFGKGPATVYRRVLKGQTT